jgi:hypothetical protein
MSSSRRFNGNVGHVRGRPGTPKSVVATAVSADATRDSGPDLVPNLVIMINRQHEEYNVARLREIALADLDAVLGDGHQHGTSIGAALVELLATLAAAEPAIAPCAVRSGSSATAVDRHPQHRIASHPLDEWNGTVPTPTGIDQLLAQVLTEPLCTAAYTFHPNHRIIGAAISVAQPGSEIAAARPAHRTLFGHPLERRTAREWCRPVSPPQP